MKKAYQFESQQLGNIRSGTTIGTNYHALQRTERDPYRLNLLTSAF
jgi:hypothetical protein